MAEIPPVSLKERLEQAILGFGQLAGCVCQGALVQVGHPQPEKFGQNPQLPYRHDLKQTSVFREYYRADICGFEDTDPGAKDRAMLATTEF